MSGKVLQVFAIILATIAVTMTTSCSNKKSKPVEKYQPKAPVTKTEKRESSIVESITSDARFGEVIEMSKKELVVIDMYADWCMPCKRLAPMLDEIAHDNIGKAKFFRLNVDKMRNIAAQFRVQSIPFVVFIKDGAAVDGIIGLHPKQAYQSSIDKNRK